MHFMMLGPIAPPPNLGLDPTRPTVIFCYYCMSAVLHMSVTTALWGFPEYKISLFWRQKYVLYAVARRLHSPCCLRLCFYQGTGAPWRADLSTDSEAWSIYLQVHTQHSRKERWCTRPPAFVNIPWSGANRQTSKSLSS